MASLGVLVTARILGGRRKVALLLGRFDIIGVLTLGTIGLLELVLGLNVLLVLLPARRDGNLLPPTELLPLLKDGLEGPRLAELPLLSIEGVPLELPELTLLLPAVGDSKGPAEGSLAKLLLRLLALLGGGRTTALGGPLFVLFLLWLLLRHFLRITLLVQAKDRTLARLLLQLIRRWQSSFGASRWAVTESTLRFIQMLSLRWPYELPPLDSYMSTLLTPFGGAI